MSKDWFERAMDGKAALRKTLTQLPIGQKLSMVEQLSERALLFRKDTSKPVSAQPWAIPNSWQWIRLADVATIVSGVTPSTDHPEYYGGDVPWVRIADITRTTDIYLSHTTRTLSQLGVAHTGARVLPANSVLWSTRVPMGQVAIAKVPVTIHQGVKGLVIADGVLPEFVYYYLLRAQEFVEPLATGPVVREITTANARRMPFPMAPLAQQQWVVREIQRVLAERSVDTHEVLLAAFAAS